MSERKELILNQQKQCSERSERKRVLLDLKLGLFPVCFCFARLIRAFFTIKRSENKINTTQLFVSFFSFVPALFIYNGRNWKHEINKVNKEKRVLCF
jgi:hypothetical protein